MCLSERQRKYDQYMFASEQNRNPIGLPRIMPFNLPSMDPVQFKMTAPGFGYSRRYLIGFPRAVTRSNLSGSPSNDPTKDTHSHLCYIYFFKSLLSLILLYGMTLNSFWGIISKNPIYLASLLTNYNFFRMCQKDILSTGLFWGFNFKQNNPRIRAQLLNNKFFLLL